MSVLKKYDFTQSPFYMVRSKKRLAEILNLSSPRALIALTDLSIPYHKFNATIKNKKRPVQTPCFRLDPLHKRIFNLLKRIELPDYLHSGTKGRSYVTNAKAHLSTTNTYTVDIRKFYPSVTRSKVYDFFRITMKCSEDVSGILANITTCDGYIPTGSSLSQLLAYLACKNMFDELNGVSEEAGAIMTCYVDDLTFSGDAVSRSWIYEKIKPIITKHSLKSHKDKFYRTGRPKEITGVIVDGATTKVCNRHQLAIHELLLEVPSAEQQSFDRTYKKLMGRLSSAAQIDQKFKAKRLAIAKRRKLRGDI